MKKKKILWLSIYTFSEEPIKSTGTWVIAMGKALMEIGEVELYNLTFGEVNEITQKDCNGIKQWIIPNLGTDNQGLPSITVLNFIKDIEAKVDLIHIWGTESPWGILAVNKILTKPILLDIQGILYAYAKVFYGGLTNAELIRCIGVKELLLPKRLFYFRKKDFERRGIIEKYIIRNISNISVQSTWVKSHIKLENSSATITDTGILLREEFYSVKEWSYNSTTNPTILTSSSGSNMYKGLHVLLRAVAILKQQYPTVQLRIAGRIIYKNKIQDGYSYWLLSLVKKLGIEDNVVWLGAIDADEIISNFREASVFVVPSYVETYCLALAEAMMVGVPSVVSYAGAMSELAVHNESALFFPVGDETSCAYQIERILKDESLSDKLSTNARKTALKRNNEENVVNRQLEIYESIITKGL
jgi:glycosyltransferase involved in cell wall biosynthesis